MLVVRNVSKRFPKQGRQGEEFAALEKVSFEVRRGEFVSVLGPSGCGKTTLIRIIAGLIPPDEGEVVVNGALVVAPGRDRCIVFQNFGLLPWRTVQANVEFGLELEGVAPLERARIAGRFIELVGLRGFERYYPHQVSGGMQQRVGIARALSRDPEILLMDEPFGAVDAQTREELQEELLQIWNQTEKTVLFVTHSIDEAIYLSDRVIIMSTRPGRVRDVVPVDLPRPRYSFDVRSEEIFVRLQRDIRSMLREIRASGKRGFHGTG